MNIVIEGKYRIRTFDLSNLVLEVLKDVNKRVKKGEPQEKIKKWCFEGYFGRIDFAVDRLLQYKLKASSVSTIKEIKECFQHAISDVTREIYNNMTEDERRFVNEKNG